LNYNSITAMHGQSGVVHQQGVRGMRQCETSPRLERCAVRGNPPRYFKADRC